MGNENAEPEQKRLTEKDKPKQPYVKPAFRFETVFVTSALTCGKNDSTSFHCRVNRKVS